MAGTLEELPDWTRALIADARVARLGLVDDEDRPRVLPVTFAVVAGALWTAVDHKPKRHPDRELARVRWLRRRPHAALTVDVYADDWSQLAWVQALGEVRIDERAPDGVLADIAALLVATSLTGPVLGPLWRRQPIRGLRLIGQPLVALPLWIVNLYVWHIPGLYQLALRNDLVHALEHLMFFACGLNMWLALTGAVPVPAWFRQGAQLAYVAAVRFAGLLLANLLIFAGSPLYPDYRSGAAIHGI